MTPSRHGLGQYRSGCLAIVLCVLLAIAALACGTSVSPTLEPCSSTPDPDLRVPTPTPEKYIYPNITWHVSPSLDEQIYTSDVIVQASLLSATAAAERVPSADDGVASTCRAVQELRFSIHEYLKGSGPDEVVVVVQGERTYLTEAEARREADESVASRNTRWDDKQGALFLRTDHTPYEPASTTDGEALAVTAAFTRSNPLQSAWDYSVDTLSRAWLPARDADGLAFITDGAGSTPPVIALAELRSAIAEMDATLKTGEGIEGYEDCINGKIMYERNRRAQPWYPSQFEKTLASGSSAWTEVYRRVNRYGDPVYNQFWLSGLDAELFRALTIDNDNAPDNGYEYMLATLRPLPAGVYHVNDTEQHYADLPCNFVPDDVYSIWTVTVTAPPGTLHEAFFDPASIGSGAGADSSNGTLEPAEFTIGGAATTIGRIGWEYGTAWMAFSSYPPLGGHHVDFIQGNGSVGLRLSFNDAVISPEANGGYVVSWGVCAQPWSGGDKLMLRMSQSEPGMTGATNDSSCDTTPTP